MTDRIGRNGPTATADGEEEFRARMAADEARRARGVSKRSQTPTARRNALQDTLFFAAQEADALSDYYAAIAKQLRALAEQVSLPEPHPEEPAPDSFGRPDLDRYAAPHERGIHTDDK